MKDTDMLAADPVAPHPVPDSKGRDAFADDPDLAALLALYLDAPTNRLTIPAFARMGMLVGDRLEVLALSADRNPPVLHHRTRTGEAIQHIEKHPDFRELERIAFGEFGLAAMAHRPGVLGADAPLPPLVKYGLVFLLVQAEFGLCCPLSMTDALTRTLRRFGAPALVAAHIDALTSQDMAHLAQGAMFMTEQEAGSDVGATATIARPEGQAWRLWGDKWFCSNPDAALAMVLARPEGAGPGTRGLSLFLLPRTLPDGTPNAAHIIRLKDKLGTRSMASGEVRLEGALAWLVGEPGEGFRQMTDMINLSRLANGVRSAGLMRRSVAEALYIARHRKAFGQRLIEMPLMRRQLAKMIMPAEQGRAMTFHACDVLARADAGEPGMAGVLRILTPLVKFRTCRDARVVAGDAMEVRGGCGYIEEFSDARVLRDAHLGSIWEGTSSIVALDVARAVRREGALAALSAHIGDLLAQTPDSAALADAFTRAAALMTRVAGDRAAEAQTRHAATALYDATSAALLAWQAARIDAPGSDRRRAIADAVLAHKLSPADPLAPPADDTASLALLLDG